MASKSSPTDVTVTPADAPVTAAEIVEIAVDATRYVVLHSGLDNWLQGEILTAEQLTGIDISRLIRLGAIALHEGA